MVVEHIFIKEFGHFLRYYLISFFVLGVFKHAYTHTPGYVFSII